MREDLCDKMLLTQTVAGIIAASLQTFHSIMSSNPITLSSEILIFYFRRGMCDPERSDMEPHTGHFKKASLGPMLVLGGQA